MSSDVFLVNAQNRIRQFLHTKNLSQHSSMLSMKRVVQFSNASIFLLQYGMREILRAFHRI